MALKVLLLRKQRENKQKELDALRAKDAEFETREADLTTAIDEVENDEQRAQVEQLVTEFETERTEHRNAVEALEAEIAQIDADMQAAEAEQSTETPAANPAPEPEKERSKNTMNIMNRALKRMEYQEREALFARDEVKNYLSEVRACIKEKRALTNVGLTIPTVMLGLLRQNVEEYSKLYKHVRTMRINGEGRLLIQGGVPEAIWTECCANINELDIVFNDMAVDCFMVAGYFAVCNATAEDSDIDLLGALLDALGASIGRALDKAILFGRNTDANSNMPMGIVSRLVQTSQPAGYPATARAWVDLHTSNVKTISSGTTGKDLFAAILTNFGAAKGKYSRGEIVHVMNETTYTYLMAQAMNVDASGAIVSRVNGSMPVLGGVIEVLDFIPDYVMISGYFDLYLLAERAGAKFATSEHVRFLQNQTVMKGTARYDGGPIIAEAFVAIGVNSTTPDATTGITFGQDKANTVQSIALNTSTLAITGTASKQLIAITAPGSGPVTWASSASGKATVDTNGVVTGVTAGTTTITATANGLTASCVVTVT